MSRDFNKVILIGRLARDPDIRYTPTKQKVARFTICTGRQWKNKATGEIQSHTDFISVVAWTFTADVIERYVKKGSQIMVEGRIVTRDYDDIKTGTHKWVTEVVAENILLLGSRRDDGAPAPYGSYQSGSQQQNNQFAPQAQPAQQYRQQYVPQSDGMPDMGSLRGEPGFGDDFPLDFAELGSAPDAQPGDADIPF